MDPLEPDQVAFYKRLESLPESEVRFNVRHGVYTGRHTRWANQWVSERDLLLQEGERDRADAAATEASALNRSMAEAARDAAEASRLQAQEASEANRLAREANDIARKANAKADTANTVATIAAIAAAISIAVAVIGAFLR